MQQKTTAPRGTILPITLVAGVLIGLVAFGGIMMTDFSSREAAMTIDPTELTTIPGHTFTISVLVSSAIPVNAFTGMVTFDHTVVSVESISYNTSIANLWTEEPWFSDGAGTINFTGGTTRSGGFTGTGELVTITFKALTPGDATLRLKDARVLEHNGLGTDVPLDTPIDTVFTVTPDTLHSVASADTASTITIAPTFATTDLNHDGRTSLADISIFMLDLATGDKRGDVNGDDRVNTTDLSIILDARSR